jgi:hypothetical protein
VKNILIKKGISSYKRERIVFFS